MKKLIYGLLICLVIVTSLIALTFEEDKTSNSKSSNVKRESHTCYVCGESGNMKYGSYYYCATHWAMVKTVAEAD